MSKEEKIKYFLFILIIGFGLSVYYHYILYAYAGLGYPWNTFLFLPTDHFNDFYNVVIKGTVQTNIYFPLANLVIAPFQMFRSPVLAMIIYMLIIFIPMLYYNYINLKSDKWPDTLMNTFVFTFLSYPLLFLIDRANFESFVYLSLCIFIVFYKNGKTVLSTIPLAFAISMKLFPAVFIILFIADKKYKEFFYTLGLIFIFSFLALLILHGSLLENLAALFGNQQKYTQNYALGFDGFDYGITLFGVLKGVLVMFNLSRFIQSVFLLYTLSAFLCFLLFSLYIIFIEKEFWKRVALLVIAMCIFPHVSGGYKLIHLMIPIYLFLNKSLENRTLSFNIFSFRIRLELLYTILFALLLIPKNYRLFFNVYDGVFVDPIIMVFISFLIIYTGLSKVKIVFYLNPVKLKEKGIIYLSE